MAKPLDAPIADFDPSLAKKLIGKQADAHAYLAMDAPDRQFDTLRIGRRLAGKNKLRDAVNERAVEIKQENQFNTLRINQA